MIRLKTQPALFVSFFLCGLFTDTFACTAPVFRYALERWAPDPYALTIFHDKPLSSELKNNLEKLSPLENSGCVKIEKRDTNKALNAERDRLWRQEKKFPSPSFALRPPSHPATSVSNGSLTLETLQQLLTLDIRGELVRKLTSGDAIVWLLIQCGDTAKDRIARDELRKYLDQAEKELKLPHELDENDTVYDMELNTSVDLALKFSIISMNRKTREEKTLIATLACLDSIAKDTKQPLAVPIFGRGRALLVMPANEIIKKNVFSVCEFLTAPCSCQIKSENPGIDLFIPIAWNELLQGTITVDEALPPLTVPGARISHSKPSSPAKTQVNQPPETNTSFFIFRRIVALVIFGFVFLLIGSIVIMRRKS